MLADDSWRATWRLYPAAVPLGLTIAKEGQGTVGVADFKAGTYPACSHHGAMNRVAPVEIWRCLHCNIGCEFALRVPWGHHVV